MGLTIEQFQGIVRHALTLTGAIILVFFADAEGVIAEVVAAGTMLAGVLWSLGVKTGQPLSEKIKGIVNHSIAILTAILVYLGHEGSLSSIELIAGTIINLLPFILSVLNKNK